LTFHRPDSAADRNSPRTSARWLDSGFRLRRSRAPRRGGRNTCRVGFSDGGIRVFRRAEYCGLPRIPNRATHGCATSCTIYCGTRAHLWHQPDVRVDGGQQPSSL